MNPKLLTALLALVAVLAAPWRPAASADDISIDIRPPAANVVLGESVDIDVQITNSGSSPTAPLVAHIDITDLADSASVDPEDWTSTLSKPAGVIEPGATAVLTWNVQPIAGGEFTLYGVVLSPDDQGIAVSQAVSVQVDDRRSLNPNNILPVAIAGPLLVGALLAATLLRTRGRRPKPVLAP